MPKLLGKTGVITGGGTAPSERHARSTSGMHRPLDSLDNVHALPEVELHVFLPMQRLQERHGFRNMLARRRSWLALGEGREGLGQVSAVLRCVLRRERLSQQVDAPPQGRLMVGVFDGRGVP